MRRMRRPALSAFCELESEPRERTCGVSQSEFVRVHRAHAAASCVTLLHVYVRLYQPIVVWCNHCRTAVRSVLKCVRKRCRRPACE